ncbi:MAG: GNAT family N-acetyltransferase [Verrucomicrobiota bacterium]
MNDLLVKLYELPPHERFPEKASSNSFIVRRAIAPEKSLITKWVDTRFGTPWADETTGAFSRQPVSCMVAHTISGDRLLGFACYHSPFLGFFGPMGVEETSQRKGVGTNLLLQSLYAIRSEGYAYAIIGQASSHEFYERTVGAVPIPGSSPGPYASQLRHTT